MPTTDNTHTHIKSPILRWCFNGLAWVLFSIPRASIFCGSLALISLWAEVARGIDTLFSCSGALFTLAGLFLNVKHSLHFHLKLPKENLANMIGGGGMFRIALTKETAEWVDSVIRDEIAGVVFIVVGTLIWGYGSFLVQLIK
ncbi:MAG: hypothetical protein HGA97_06405 [Chlorobiaceae bacterium]|nr:hypothetical protein [Chlorobiaceae bacterium]